MADEAEKPTTDAKPEEKPEAKKDTAAEAKADAPKADAKAEDKKAEDKPAAKTEDKPAAKAEDKPAAKADAKPAAEKKPAAKADDAKPAAKKPVKKKPAKKKAPALPPREPTNPERWQEDPIRGLKTSDEHGVDQSRVAQLNHLKDVYADLTHDAKAEGFVKDIDTALERIENGTYNLCTACQREIPRDDIRRQNSPWLTTCSYYLRKKEWCER